MQYAERLPHTRSLLGPALALAVGAAAATGAYAVLDDRDADFRPAAAKVVVVEMPAPSGPGGLELRGSKASQTGTTVPVTGEPGSPGTQYGTSQYRLGR